MPVNDPIDKTKKPTAKEVGDFHTNADTDGSQKSLHHTLGSTHNQASPGDHNHDGGSSTRLLDGVTLTGTRGTATAMTGIIAALVQLGATDATTA